MLQSVFCYFFTKKLIFVSTTPSKIFCCGTQLSCVLRKTLDAKQKMRQVYFYFFDDKFFLEKFIYFPVLFRDIYCKLTCNCYRKFIVANFRHFHSKSTMGDHYGFSLTTFSPSGKLMQIEYALNAVRNGQPSVGLRGKDLNLVIDNNFMLF